MAGAKATSEWANNAAQWIRTALTDLRHAVGQAEIGRKRELVESYERLCRSLEQQNSILEQKYGVAPPTGKGRRNKRDK